MLNGAFLLRQIISFCSLKFPRCLLNSLRLILPSNFFLNLFGMNGSTGRFLNTFCLWLPPDIQMAYFDIFCISSIQ